MGVRTNRHVSAGPLAAALIVLGLVLGEIPFSLGPRAGLLSGALSGILALPVLLAGVAWGQVGRQAQGRRRGRVGGGGFFLDFVLLTALVAGGYARSSLARVEWTSAVAQAKQLEGEAWIQARWSHLGGRDLLRIAMVRPLGKARAMRLRHPLPLLLCSVAPPGMPSPAADGFEGWVEGFVRIEAPRGPRGPGAWNDSPYLRARAAGGWARPILLVRVRSMASSPGGARDSGVRIWSVGRRWVLGLGQDLARLRGELAEWIALAVGGRGGVFAASFLLGRRALPRSGDVPADALYRAGAGHLLAVSGLHVGLVSTALAIILWLLPLGRRVRWLLLGLALPAYGSLVGWSTSVARAAAVGSLWCLLRAAQRRAGTLGLLLAVLACSLWSRPGCWREAGFQLSYLVSLALIGVAGGRWGEDRPGSKASLRDRAAWPRGRSGAVQAPRWMRPAMRGGAALLAAQATAWPLVLAHFGWASPLFLLSNAILVPLAGILMPVLLTCLLLACLPAFARDVALAPAQLAAEGFLALAGRLGDWCDGAFVGLEVAPGLGLGAAAVIAGICVLRRVRLSVRLAIAVCISVLLTIAGSTRERSPVFLMLDVGQGESWVLLWKEETWVIDLGPEPGVAGRPWRCVSRALRRFGRRRIDRLFLTHDDCDHVGGGEEILKAGLCTSVIHHPHGWRPCARTRAWLGAMRARGARLRGLARGDTLRSADGLVIILHPGRTAAAYADDNAGSLAMRVEAHGLGLVIAGDVPGWVENQWLEEHLPVRAQLVSAAHHGSGGSTPERFLRGSRAQAVLISAGRANRFGHPAARVLEDLARCGCRCLRTDRDGTIIVARDSRGWSVQGWASKRGFRIEDMRVHSPVSCGQQIQMGGSVAQRFRN